MTRILGSGLKAPSVEPPKDQRRGQSVWIKALRFPRELGFPLSLNLIQHVAGGTTIAHHSKAACQAEIDALPDGLGTINKHQYVPIEIILSTEGTK